MKNYWIFLILIITVFVVAGCDKEIPEATPEIIEFANCLRENGVVMYSSITCHVCDTQKEMFMNPSGLVKSIECNPNGPNAQPFVCVEKGIEATPTWTLENDEGNEIKRVVGLQNTAQLAEFSGCPAP